MLTYLLYNPALLAVVSEEAKAAFDHSDNFFCDNFKSDKFPHYGCALERNAATFCL